MLDEALTRSASNGAISSALSARHVPNDIFQVAAIPRTLSGKKMELPVKKLLHGHAGRARWSTATRWPTPACVDWFVDFAARRAAAPAKGG